MGVLQLCRASGAFPERGCVEDQPQHIRTYEPQNIFNRLGSFTRYD